MKRCKILGLATLLILQLAACGTKEMPEPLSEEDREQFASQLEAESQAEEPEENDPALAPLEEVLLDPIQRRILLSASVERLEQEGIAVTAENIHIPQQTMYDILEVAGALKYDSSWTELPEALYSAAGTAPWGASEAGFPFTFDLVLTKEDGASQRISLEAYACYGGPLTGNIKPVWGSLSLMDEDTIAISTLQDVTFYSLRYLVPTEGHDINLSPFSGKSFAIHSVVYHPKLGYVAPMYLEEKNYLTLFDQTGNLKESYHVPTQDYRGFDADPVRYVTYLGAFDVVDLDVPVLIFEDKSHSGSNISIFRTDDFTEKIYSPLIELDGTMQQHYYAPDDTTKVYLYHTYDTEGVPFYGADTGIVAFYEKKGRQGGYAQFGTDIPMRWDFGFLRAGSFLYEGEEIAGFHENEQIFTMYSPTSGQRMEVDFKTHSGTLFYEIRPDKLSGLVEASPNGRYQIWQAYQDATGDAYWGNLVLQDTQTGTMHYLGEYGSSYITEPVNFLNDDSILYKPLVLQVYLFRSADAVCYREITLQYTNEIEGRVSFNTTYDMSTDRYYVAYIDGNTSSDFPRDFSMDTYSVAVFDSDGRQLRTIETDISGSVGPVYSLYCPPMRVEGEILWLDGKQVDLSISLIIS